MTTIDDNDTPTVRVDLRDVPAAATMVVRVGYRGHDFCGFAEQPDQRTVAGDLRRALETFLRRPVELTCAGRTDAGVHSMPCAQHVSLPVTADELSIDRRTLQRALTALVDDDISIGGVFRARAGFSARFDAVSRSYRYRICEGWVRPVMAWEHAWWLRAPLDAEAMDEAARCLEGEHDFKSFCKASSAVGKPTCRHVVSCRVSRIEEAGESLVALDITGNAFLHSMVRTITGTLVEVGRGHRDAAWVADVLAACDRRAAGQCAPAKGLSFAAVEYPDGSLAPWPCAERE